MSYTAIVLDARSHDLAVNRANGLSALPNGWTRKAHHVTLCMGAKTGKFKIGETRRLVATHYGETAGRVCAFRVKGADDSENALPHVTVAHHPDAKPVESNAIAEWKELSAEQIFPLVGVVKIC